VKRFDGQVAIVTGAASGIGRATAVRLAAEGAAVVIADLNAEGAGDVAKTISAEGGRALALEVDVTDAPGVRAMTERAVGTFGKVDILVSNAGWDRAAPFSDTDERALGSDHRDQLPRSPGHHPRRPSSHEGPGSGPDRHRRLRCGPGWLQR